MSSLYILDISLLSDLGLIKILSQSVSGFCLTEVLQFYEVPFVDSRSYSISHWCSVREFFPCAHIFEAFSHFLLYKFQEWIQKMSYIYTMEYYSTIKKNEFMKVLGKWLDLEGIILSEVTQSQKNSNDMYSMISG